MTSFRFEALKAASNRKPVSVPDLGKKSDIFASNVFNDKVMRQHLTSEAYKAVRSAMDYGTKIDRKMADFVALGMKEWAMSKGVTHYTHWFQPLTGTTAEKHDAFFETSFHWKKEGDSGACIISYTAFDDSQIEDDYEDYENLNQITIADKTYKVLTNDDTASLLYKVDDWFYIRIDLWNAVQFDENGDETTLTFAPAYLLENGYLDDEIIMDIEEE